MYIYIYIYIYNMKHIYTQPPPGKTLRVISFLSWICFRLLQKKNRNAPMSHFDMMSSFEKLCTNRFIASSSFPAFPGKSQGSEDFTSEGHGKKPGWIIKIGEAEGQKITLGIPRKIPVVSISFDLLKKIKEGADTLEDMFDDFRTKIKGRLYSCGSWMTHVSRFSRRVNYDSLYKLRWAAMFDYQRVYSIYSGTLLSDLSALLPTSSSVRFVSSKIGILPAEQQRNQSLSGLSGLICASYFR